MQLELILPLVLWESGGWVEFPGRKERAQGLSNRIVLSSQVHKDTGKLKGTWFYSVPWWVSSRMIPSSQSTRAQRRMATLRTILFTLLLKKLGSVSVWMSSMSARLQVKKAQVMWA